MSEEEYTLIFSRRLRYYLDLYGMTQLELSKRVGVSSSTVTDWCKGRITPRMDKIDKMCEIFHCKRSDFMYEKKPEHYYEEEAAAVAQELMQNQELRLLFDAAKDCDPQTLRTIHDMLMVLKRKEDQ